VTEIKEYLDMADLKNQLSAAATSYFSCPKCPAHRAKPCVTKSGAKYPTGMVHAARYKLLIERRPEVAESITAAAEATAQAAVDAVVDHGGESVETFIRNVAAAEAAQARLDRVKMVRGTFQMLINLIGEAEMLDKLAQVLVDYDVDTAIIWQSERDPR